MGHYTKVTLGKNRVVKRAQNETGKRLLQREAKVLEQVRGHFGAPVLLEAQLEGNSVSITLQRAQGRSLQEEIIQLKRTKAHLPATRTVLWLQNAACALDTWHRGTNMVHGDVSPANLILHNDNISLIDFALATPFGRRVEVSGTGFANPAYASPEQLAGNVIEARSDQYALAIIASELLTGTRFDRASPEAGLALLPKNVHRALLRALSPDRTTCFANCTAMIASISASENNPR